MKTLLRLNLHQFEDTFDPDNVLLQDAVDGNIPSEQGTLIMTDFLQNSVVAQLAQHEPMTKPVKEFSYLAEGPGAYWVSETERIQTSKAKWLMATMEAKKLGVIIPVSKEFLRYTLTNFFNAIRPGIASAFSKKIDLAALFGVDTPYAQGQSVWERIQASGNTVPLSDTLYDDLNSLIGLIEEADGNPNGLTTTRRFNQKLRGAKDEIGDPIFNDARQGATAQALGLPIGYASADSWDFTKALLLTGDWQYARYGVLQNIEYAISQEATLTTLVDQDGNPTSLFERDMFALRATMHVGFMTLKDTAFAAITPASGGNGGGEDLKKQRIEVKPDGFQGPDLTDDDKAYIAELEKLTNDQLKAQLDAEKVEYAVKATKQELISLILAHEAQIEANAGEQTQGAQE